MTRRTASGSNRSPSAVDSTTSQNMHVTVLRTSWVAAAVEMTRSAGSGAPHCRQKRAGRDVSSWQRSQRIATADSGSGAQGDCDVVIRGGHTVRRVRDRVVGEGRLEGSLGLSRRARETGRGGDRPGYENDAAGDPSVPVGGKLGGRLNGLRHGGLVRGLRIVRTAIHASERGGHYRLEAIDDIAAPEAYLGPVEQQVGQLYRDGVSRRAHLSRGL